MKWRQKVKKRWSEEINETEKLKWKYIDTCHLTIKYYFFDT